jgi:hypothetical protein
MSNKRKESTSFFWDNLDALDDEAPFPQPAVVLKHGDLHLSVLPLPCFDLPCLQLQPLPPRLLLQVLLAFLNRSSAGELEPEVHRDRPPVRLLGKHHVKENLVGESWCQMGQIQLPMDLQPTDVLQRHCLDFGIIAACVGG